MAHATALKNVITAEIDTRAIGVAQGSGLRSRLVNPRLRLRAAPRGRAGEWGTGSAESQTATARPRPPRRRRPGSAARTPRRRLSRPADWGAPASRGGEARVPAAR